MFFVQADHQGTAALMLPHAGYHHLAMRLWAGMWVGLGVPVLWLPTLFVGGALLGWLAVVSFLFSSRLELRWRPVMLAALVLLPATHEVWFNLTNLQWTLALLWPLWWSARDPATKRGLVGESVAQALVGLTGVFVVLAAPWFVLRAIRRRSVAALVAAGVTVLAAAVQLRVALATTGGMGIEWSAGDALAVLGQRVGGLLFLPANLPTAVMTWGGLSLLGLVLLGWGWRARQETALRGWGVWVLLGLGVVAATLLRFPESLRPLQGGFNGERYFWVPKILLVWVILQVAARSAGWWRWAGLGLVVLALAVALPRWRLPRLEDNDWPTWAARIETGEEVGWVPITPTGMNFYYAANPRRQAD